jgi:hypothetical protein
MTKTRTVDVDKVTASLKKAAAAATSGSRDVRAGKFVATDATKRPAANEQEHAKRK